MLYCFIFQISGIINVVFKLVVLVTSP
jgi:hypothetical protein